MNAENQRRIGQGLLLLLVAFGLQLVLGPILDALSALIMVRDASNLDAVFKVQRFTHFATDMVVSAFLLSGAVLLLRSLGSYAQFLLAGLAVSLGLEVLTVSLAAFSPSWRSTLTVTSLVGLVSTVVWVATSVALLLLLRKATAIAGSRASTVASVLVCVKLVYSLIFPLVFVVWNRLAAPDSLVLFRVAGMAMNTAGGLSFMWLAFRARRAVLGLLLDATVAGQDAYRGPTALR